MGNVRWEKLFPLFGSRDWEKRLDWVWEMMVSFPTILIPAEGVGYGRGLTCPSSSSVHYPLCSSREPSRPCSASSCPQELVDRCPAVCRCQAASVGVTQRMLYFLLPILFSTSFPLRDHLSL
uniref:Uncharacterized protein n=1 Tax=Arundo donax TaxID=35708 RepID=A0A0A9ETN1_ARUDO